ncbi:hypothetical protein JM80_0178 [Cellulophaga sp. RHA_52]|nr:hypothetical protein JM80_0178 [Cellulophaga sp. RHA_52]
MPRLRNWKRKLIQNLKKRNKTLVLTAMRKTILIIGVALALVNVVYSFMRDAETVLFFGKDINIWVYRLIWAFMAVLIFNAYRKEAKK